VGRERGRRAGTAIQDASRGESTRHRRGPQASACGKQPKTRAGQTGAALSPSQVGPARTELESHVSRTRYGRPEGRSSSCTCCFVPQHGKTEGDAGLALGRNGSVPGPTRTAGKPCCEKGDPARAALFEAAKGARSIDDGPPTPPRPPAPLRRGRSTRADGCARGLNCAHPAVSEAIKDLGPHAHAAAG